MWTALERRRLLGDSMRKLTLALLSTLTIAFPLYAAQGREQSYFTYDDGGTIIRLADGNIIALDRSTSIRFRSINDSYDDNSTQTVVELRYGHVIAQRTDFHREAMRLDTASASYFAADQAIYAVDNDGRTADRVSVFYGEIEVRT